MKIDFQETTDDLLKRIDIHNRFGTRDIDAWMLDILNLQPEMKILDVGCGAGKQCFSFFNQLKGEVDITGTDVSEELLEQARLENKKTGEKITFLPLDFNQPFNLPENTFDLESCCFAIYYAQDIPFTIAEMHKVLKPGGRLFVTGPMPQNKAVFYDVIREATQKAIPPMPGSSRYSTEIYTTIEQLFSSVETHIFENPLVFDTAEPFIEYTRASLSEDRRLWKSFFTTHEDFENIMAQITEVVKAHIVKDGKLVMTKVVGGFLATK